jgi:hypothetical protein
MIYQTEHLEGISRPKQGFALPQEHQPFPRLFRSPFCLKRVSSDHVRRTSATAERNNLICERYREGTSLNGIAHEFGLSIQRVHQIIRGRRK